MAHPDTTEKKRLLAASAVIADATSGLNNYAEAKLTLLEYVSCSYSGISITDYFRVRAIPLRSSLRMKLYPNCALRSTHVA